MVAKGGFAVRVVSKNGSKFKVVLVDGKAVRVAVDSEAPVDLAGDVEPLTGAKLRNITVAHLFVNKHPHLRYAPTNPRQIELFQDSDGLTQDAAGVATAKRCVFSCSASCGTLVFLSLSLSLSLSPPWHCCTDAFPRCFCLVASPVCVLTISLYRVRCVWPPFLIFC